MQKTLEFLPISILPNTNTYSETSGKWVESSVLSQNDIFSLKVDMNFLKD